MSVMPAIDCASAATQAIIQHLLTDSNLFGTEKVQQPDIANGYVGVYPKVVPPPGVGFGRDDLYPAIVVTPQGITPEYTLAGGPNAIGFHGPVQIMVVIPGRETASIADLVDEMYSWLWELNKTNATLIQSIFPVLQIDMPELDEGSNPWSWLGGRCYVTGKMS